MQPLVQAMRLCRVTSKSIHIHREIISMRLCLSRIGFRCKIVHQTQKTVDKRAIERNEKPLYFNRT